MVKNLLFGPTRIAKSFVIEPFSTHSIQTVSRVFAKLIKFAQTLKAVCIECVENGSMTKDLAILVGPNSKFLTTNQFLDEIDGNLKKKLN